ncbi:(2Fe-2S)-binding protein [Saccharopolyspora sp. K220]|uniref:(2Fe-2S)-binding protein n=1 Tax=Saccharopolyspora soli TaxID=2926618 RepID=UPI001F5A6AA7|nr:(2Fe-2S)-binding protein [Saccharopolyspora soli]MCI2422243.1 (2Fe-2S)-binding protein [Saccharopolyspora soli]
MTHDISVRVNGAEGRGPVADRLTLADYLRERRGLTGTKLGCEQGVCGACTVLLDGESVRSCLVLAAQADEFDVVTVEGLTAASAAAGDLREAFARHDALQCGFCTPGFLVAGVELLARDELDEATVREALSGNLCRCTGYGGIVAAILDVHGRRGAVPITACPEETPPTHGDRRRAAVLLLLAGLALLVGLLVRRWRSRTEGGPHE